MVISVSGMVILQQTWGLNQLHRLVNTQTTEGLGTGQPQKALLGTAGLLW